MISDFTPEAHSRFNPDGLFMKSHPAYSDSGDSMEALIKEVTHVAVKSLRSGSSEVSKALLTTVVVVKKAKPPIAHAKRVEGASSILDKKSYSTSRST